MFMTSQQWIKRDETIFHAGIQKEMSVRVNETDTNP